MPHQKMDAPSAANHFGWEKISEEEAVPVIVRSNNVRYSPVRVVEQEIIKKFDSLPPNVFQCITLKSLYPTAQETKLLNAINFNHCNSRYGEEFFTPQDVIIKADDVKELQRYLRISNEIFSNDLQKNSEFLGVARIVIDPHEPNSTMLLPYIVRKLDSPTSTDQAKFVPLRLLQSFGVYCVSAQRTSPNEWDIMYLKMLSIYCELNAQNFISLENDLITLEGLAYTSTNQPLVYEAYLTNNFPAR